MQLAVATSALITPTEEIQPEQPTQLQLLPSQSQIQSPIQTQRTFASLQWQSPTQLTCDPFTDLAETVESITAHLCNSSIGRQQQTVHSPPMRSPGFSPPLRRARRHSNGAPVQFNLEDEGETMVETVNEEEEQEESNTGNADIPPDEPPVPPALPTIEQEKETSKALDFNVRDAVVNLGGNLFW